MVRYVTHHRPTDARASGSLDLGSIDVDLNDIAFPGKNERATSPDLESEASVEPHSNPHVAAREDVPLVPRAAVPERRREPSFTSAPIRRPSTVQEEHQPGLRSREPSLHAALPARPAVRGDDNPLSAAQRVGLQISSGAAGAPAVAPAAAPAIVNLDALFSGGLAGLTLDQRLGDGEYDDSCSRPGSAAPSMRSRGVH